MARKAPWHERRFTEQPGYVSAACQECGRPMWLPPSRVQMYHRCSPACSAAARARTREETRRRECETCARVFYPRPQQLRAGGGRFCSQGCNTASRAALNATEVKMRAKEANRAAWAAGTRSALKGADNPRWKGGVAARKDRQASEEAIQARRQARRLYLAKNREKSREWAQGRRGLPRLPWGTIPRIGEAQRWRCGICRADIRNGYHVDHVVPLKRGGEHAARNLQLLCQTCNVRKSAKDPIDYMRERGFLL